MAKEAKKYFEVNPWKVIENGFDPKQGRVSESIFSLGNEYMGMRGQFDETYSGDKLIGSYFNGIFEDKPLSYPEYFKGFAKRCCFMINANNWLYTRIFVDGTELDLAKVAFKDFYRELDMKTGIVTRSFTALGVKFTFERFVCIADHHIGGQKITFESQASHEIRLISGIDFTPVHEEEGKNYWHEAVKGENYIVGKTLSSGQRIFSKFKTDVSANKSANTEKIVANEYNIHLENTFSFEKVVYNYAERDESAAIDYPAADTALETSYEEYKAKHIARWAEIWKHSDIVIDGDDDSQQGIRFCIFNMHQTYHGDDGRLNVGAKGLTGEKYSGWTFWDSETYCLPFYMFNNPKAAKNLLMYRYNTLKQAKERAIEQDCAGACFPMVTIDGTESCGVWQHGNLEIHVTAAVAYGVWHYVRNTGDTEFLKKYGMELLIETSRYFASRGGWSPKTGEFGLYGVMGPDEFHMMVNNNTYTNYMVKKNFLYTIETVKKYGGNVSAEELAGWQEKADKMRINYDEKTKLFEQHDGYFDLPEYDVKHMDPDKCPIYKFWAYDSIQKENPDCIVAYRLGDFYEIMGEKAEQAANILDLTLTGRNVGLPERVPMCGFPYHVTELYIEKLLDKVSVIVVEPDKEPFLIKSHVEEQNPLDLVELSPDESTEIDGIISEPEESDEPTEEDFKEAFESEEADETEEADGIQPDSADDAATVEPNADEKSDEKSGENELDEEETNEEEFTTEADKEAEEYDVEKSEKPKKASKPEKKGNTAISRLPQDFYVNPEPTEETETQKNHAIEVDYSVRQLNYKAENGKLYRRVGDEMKEEEIPHQPKDAYERIEKMIGLRTALREIIEIQTKNCDDETLSKAQEKLGKLYDGFVKKYGYINSSTNERLFREDGDSALLFACEEMTENRKSVKKADIFTKRTIRPYEAAVKTENCLDALQISKNDCGNGTFIY